MGCEMMDIIYSCVVLAVLALILLVGAKTEDSSVEAKTTLLRLNNLRGIFALEIVIGHVIRYEKTLLFPLGRFMIISVAFFFFVSAFGMVQSFYDKENYLKNFLFPKVGYMIGLALLIYVINVVLDFFIPYSIGFYNKGELLSGFVPLTNWYIWEQIFFYFLFWIIYKYVKKYRVLCIFLITLVGITLVFEAGWSQAFYASSMAFPLGIMFGEYYAKSHSFLCSFKGIIVTIVGGALGLSSLLLGTDSLLGMVYLRNIMCISGIFVVMLVTNRLSFDNRILRFLRKYSVEIYLMQFIFLSWFERLGIHYMLRIPIVIICTIIGAILVHPIFGIFRKMARRC